MPPASRGSYTITARLRHKHLSLRRHVSTAPPAPPTQPRGRSPQLPRRTNPRLEAEAQARTKAQAEAEAKRHGETGGGQGGRARSRFVPKYLHDRPYLRAAIYSFVISAPISAAVLMHLPFEVRRVTGPSMQPTINPDCASDHDQAYSPTWVLVRRWNMNYRRSIKRKQSQEGSVTVIAGDYERGDLIVYNTPHDPHKVAIKRVVALAGDTVTPLHGYAAGDDAVVIPFNHMWVEGDVNDRKKSVDSNYFGPISTGLIRGKVIALWSPWWNVFGIRLLRGDQDEWPARKQARVKADAVHDASIDPNRVEVYSAFSGERGEKVLQLLRRHPTEMEEAFLASEGRRLQVWRFWQRASVAARHHHEPETRKRARDIVDELERLHGKNALKAAGALQPKEKRQRGVKDSDQSVEAETAQYFENATAYEDVRAQERKTRENPAKAALEDMLKQKKAYSDMVDREFEERREARSV